MTKHSEGWLKMIGPLRGQPRGFSKAFGYIRVSKGEQAVDHLSPEHQRACTEGFWREKLEKDGVRWGEWIGDEGVSAYKRPLFKRRRGRRLLKLLQPGDHLIATTFDRVFRSCSDFCACFPILKNLGVTLHLLNSPFDPESANGRAMAQMMAVFAEWESGAKSERILAIFKMMRAEGRLLTGQRPRGYKIIYRTRLGVDRAFLSPDWQERAVMWFCNWTIHTAKMRSRQTAVVLAAMAKSQSVVAKYPVLKLCQWDLISNIHHWAALWRAIVRKEGLGEMAVWPEEFYSFLDLAVPFISKLDVSKAPSTGGTA